MIQDVAAIIGVLIVLVPLFGYICAACYKSFKAFKMVTAIAEQFKPNGGSTLTDKISAIGSKLDMMIAANDVSMNLLTYPLFKADRFGMVYWGNRQFSHDTGLSECEYTGLGWLSIVAEIDRHAVRAEWIDAVADARAVTIEFDLEDGRAVVLDALPVKASKGLEGMLGVLRVSRGYFDG